MRGAVSIISAIVVICGIARGDEIQLKNGAVLQGRIVREDKDSIVVDLGRGRMSVARRDIVSIRKTSLGQPADSPQDEREPKRKGDGTRRGAPAQPNGALPPAAGIPRTPVVPVPRKKPGGPKVVPVERIPPSRLKNVGPEAPARSRPASLPAQRPPTRPAPTTPREPVKTDW